MWRADAKAFAAAHGISRDRARMFRLTAEHLAAKMDGGRTIASNIGAACRYCNHGRHALFPGAAPDPEAYSFCCSVLPPEFGVRRARRLSIRVARRTAGPKEQPTLAA
jgi:hypothetical protein